MKLKIIPVSFFGIVLGLVGMGNCWRLASKVWQLPKEIGEYTLLLAGIVWAILIFFYISKLLWARNEAIAELKHPIQCNFIGLTGVATLLMAVAIKPYHYNAAMVFYIIGSVVQLCYGIYITRSLWKGENDPNMITPALYLPSVAGNFVSAYISGVMDHHTMGFIFLGVGLFSWLNLESIITNSLNHRGSMPLPIRPTLGIMLAPPAVGCVAYLSNTNGTPDIFAKALLGYAIFQFLKLLSVFPWVSKQPFTAGYWAFSFGVTALAGASVSFVTRGVVGNFEWLSISLFIFANIVILILVVKTLILPVQGKLLPQPIKASTN
jgi:tellurite resistance protein